MTGPHIFATLRHLYGSAQHEGSQIVFIQAPSVRDHWQDPAALAFTRLGIDTGSHRIVRAWYAFPEGEDAIEWNDPDCVEYV